MQGSDFDEAEFFGAIARSGARVAFDDVWPRRRTLVLGPGTTIAIPALDDLILTKRFGGRPKDLEDIRLLEALRTEEP